MVDREFRRRQTRMYAKTDIPRMPSFILNLMEHNEPVQITLGVDKGIALIDMSQRLHFSSFL